MGNDFEELKNSFDRTAEIYDQETDTFHHRISEYITINNLLPELPEDKNIKILDAGGGTGKYSIFLYELGYKPDLIDISSKSVSIAESKAEKAGFRLKATVGNLEETRFKNNSYDFIMMNGAVISYTPDPEKLLAESWRILNKNGRLWFDFHNSLGWAIESRNAGSRVDISMAENRLIQMPDWDYPARLFSISHMEKMLIKAGFKIKAKYGLVMLSTSLPLEYRYSNNYDSEMLEKYKKAELEISRRKDCTGASWGCIICADKIM